MIPAQVFAAVVLVVALGSSALGWSYRAALCDRALADVRHQHDVALQQATKERQALAVRISESDQAATARLLEAKGENDRLSAAVAAGERRLRVAASCPASAPATSAGVDHAAAPELDAASRPAYFALRDGIDQQRQQLMACQSVLRSERE